MNTLVIGGSNSRHSINRAFAQYVAAQWFGESQSRLVDVSQMDIPLFSVDLEREVETPAAVLDFAAAIDACDLIILSLAENNGSYNAGFKNLVDWTSRIPNRSKTWGNKPMLLLSTSPGSRGGSTVLGGAAHYFPFMGADIKGTFSLPKFREHFDAKEGITNPELLAALANVVGGVKEAVAA